MEISEVCNFNTSSSNGTINFKLCILCQEIDRKKTEVKKTKDTSYCTLLDKLKFWSEVKDGRHKRKMCDLLKDETQESLKKKQAFWHRQCYSWYTSVSHENRAEYKSKLLDEGYAKDEDATDDSIILPKRTTRSSIDSYDKNICFFCQDDKPNIALFNLRSFNRSSMMKSAIEVTKNETFRIRFSSVIDAHAADVKYHTSCMITNVDKVLESTNPDLPADDDELAKILAAQQEIITEVENGIKTGSCYTMKDITSAYLQTCQRFGVSDTRKERSLRKELKSLLLSEIDGIEFQTSTKRNESEKVYSS